MLPLPFGNSLYRWVFWAGFSIWLVPEWIGAAIQRAKGDAQVRDHGSYALLMLGLWSGIAANFSLPRLVPGATITWQRSLLFSMGIAFMLLGVALRWYAIRVLGRYFTREVAVRPDQQVVQSGPYRYIRHPAYSGTLLTMLGMGLTMTNWVSLIALMICMLPGHAYRVAVEERALCEKLGQPYVDYMRRTRRFIPFVL